MFRGKAVALDKATGKVLWEHYTAVPPASGAAIWSSPSVDLEAGMAFFSTGNNYTGVGGDESDSIIALDLETGMLLWKHAERSCLLLCCRHLVSRISTSRAAGSRRARTNAADGGISRGG